jgi:hypothetical protein
MLRVVEFISVGGTVVNLGTGCCRVTRGYGWVWHYIFINMGVFVHGCSSREQCRFVCFWEGRHYMRFVVVNPPCHRLCHGKTDLVVVAVQGAPRRTTLHTFSHVVHYIIGVL